MKREFMPRAARMVFDKINEFGGLADAILIGGTALSVQCGHRLSEGLDFWLPNKLISQSDAGSLLHYLQESCEIKLMTPQSQIVSARINGTNLLDFSRDYSVNGVKVTFFHRNDFPYKKFSKMPLVQLENVRAMHPDGIFCMKAYVITQRVKSRDLFDLMYFLKNGKTLTDILEAIRDLLPHEFSDESVKAILSGEIPLDKDDEGIFSVSDSATIEDVYSFFRSQINETEKTICDSIKRSYKGC